MQSPASKASDDLDQIADAEQACRQSGDRIALAELLVRQAALLAASSPAAAVNGCDEAERLFRAGGVPLRAVEARLSSSQILLGAGDWQGAEMRLGECRVLLDTLQEGEESPRRLRFLQLRAEVVYVSYQMGEDRLEELYRDLLALAEHLEKTRRLRPGSFDTLWLFGQLDVYERLVAVAHQLGLVAEAANWAERTKSRRLLDLLLNLPLSQEDGDASG